MTFAESHPFVLFIFFICVIGSTMLLLNPVFLCVSLITSISLAMLCGGGNRKKIIFFYGVIFLTTVLINPLLTTAGETTIYEIGSRPITLEAVLYGMAVATMLVAALSWFSCYNKFMTSDKFVYLFGKVLPTFALTVVITLRLVPTFQQQLTKISLAQKAIGMDYTVGTVRERLQRIVRILSILLTGALENAMETAASMKARGYGLPNKSSFSIFMLTRQDKQLLSIFLLLIGLVLIGVLSGDLRFSYYPRIEKLEMTGLSAMCYVSFFLLCSCPILIELKEKWKWRLLK